MLRTLSLAVSLLCALLLMGCEDIEGNSPGECEDGADNDSDGYFDCGDSDCFGAPVCNGGGDDDDAADDDDVAADDDDDDDDDDGADDDDSTPLEVTPYIGDVTYVYQAAASRFVFSIEAFDPDENFGIPLLLWSVDGSAQPPVNVGSVPLQGIAAFDIELNGAVAGTTYQVLFAIQDQDGNASAGYSVSATAQ